MRGDDDPVSKALELQKQFHVQKQRAIETLLKQRSEIDNKLKELGYEELLSAKESEESRNPRVVSDLTRLKQRAQWFLRRGITEEEMLKDREGKNEWKVNEALLGVYRQLKAAGSTGYTLRKNRRI